MVFDFDVKEFADFAIDGNEDAAVDVGGVPHRSGDAFFFDQDAFGFAELGFVDLLGHFVDGRGKFAVTFLLGGVMDVVVHLVRAGPFFFGILEDTTAFKFEGLDELEEFLMIGVGFAGESGDEGSPDGEIGNAGSHSLEEIADIFSVGLAVHCVEHVVGNMLQGNVDIARDLGALGEWFGLVRRTSGPGGCRGGESRNRLRDR